jgi:hypothetical protein
MGERADGRSVCRSARSEEMNPDLFLTIAFVLYAVVGGVMTGLLVRRSERDTVLDQAVESRLAARARRP